MAETLIEAQGETSEPTDVESVATPVSEATAVPPAATPAPKPPRGTWGLEVGSAVQQEAVDAVLATLNGAGTQSETVLDKADLRLSAESTADAKLAWERVLVPVDRMSSVLTGVTLQELRDVWTGAGTSKNFATIYPDETIVPYLDALLGMHGPAVKPQPKAALADALWADRMGLAIVPFEDLNVRLRAIPVDGNSPTDNRFRAAEWPLTARAWLAPITERGQSAMAAVAGSLPLTNRDPRQADHTHHDRRHGHGPQIGRGDREVRRLRVSGAPDRPRAGRRRPDHHQQ